MELHIRAQQAAENEKKSKTLSKLEQQEQMVVESMKKKQKQIEMKKKRERMRELEKLSGPERKRREEEEARKKYLEKLRQVDEKYEKVQREKYELAEFRAKCQQEVINEEYRARLREQNPALFG